uniref:Uncharacterized protein n=1 Tax=Brassica campestris TaxID=3711 RepID=A0A3P5Y7C5_BRACM|nr:unnamed protein product [Brassica rapa]
MATQKKIQTSSASNEKVTIQHFRPQHTTKLLLDPKHQLSGETMEFILADENGGFWRKIWNFHVRPAIGAYRSTNHQYNTRSNHMNDELYLNLADFQTVFSGTLDEKI